MTRSSRTAGDEHQVTLGIFERAAELVMAGAPRGAAPAWSARQPVKSPTVIGPFVMALEPLEVVEPNRRACPDVTTSRRCLPRRPTVVLGGGAGDLRAALQDRIALARARAI
jgi:hypothetical protein